MIGGSVSLELDIYQAQSDLYFMFRGRIVLDECERLRSTCLPLISKGVEQVMIDMSKVDFIDSAGLGLLVGFKMTASKNKARIMLLQPSKPVADILYISKLDGIFEIITGAQAEAFRTQIVQPQNKVGEGASSAPQGGRTAAAQGVSADWMNSKLDTAFNENSGMASGQDGGNAGQSSAPPQQKADVEDHCRKAVEYMRQGNYEMSVQEYTAALVIDPDYLPALNNLAIVYEKQPSWNARAIQTWEQVLRISQQRDDQKHTDRAQRHLSNLRKMQS